MSSTIIIKNSVTTGSSPSSLETGEFAINVADGNLFYGSGSDVKQNIALGQLTLGGFSDVSASLASALVNTDDLGNHTATQDLNMAGFNIDAAKEITASGNISASGDVTSNSSLIIGRQYFGESGGSNIHFAKAGNNLALNNGGLNISEITASGNISSSGVVKAEEYHLDGNIAITGDSANQRFAYGDNIAVQIGRSATNPVTFTGNITASRNISASGDIHSEYAYIGDGPHSYVVDRFLHLTSDSSVYFRMTSNTNGNSIIEFHNNQEPDFMIGSFFNVGGIQIRSEDKQYAKFGESGSAHQIELSGSVGITGPVAELNVAGDGNFTGSLTAAVKSFSIPHKTHKGKKLVYGVLEGPEHSVYVRGRVKENKIDLPEEWTWLVDEDSITVQLTPIGKGQSLYIKEVSNSRIFIENDAMFSSKIDAYYTIHATRKDVKKLKTVQ